jgi:hypothetical protein
MLEIANGGIDVAFKSIGSEMYNESISTYIGLNIRYHLRPTRSPPLNTERKYPALSTSGFFLPLRIAQLQLSPTFRLWQDL